MRLSKIVLARGIGVPTRVVGTEPHESMRQRLVPLPVPLVVPQHLVLFGQCLKDKRSEDLSMEGVAIGVDLSKEGGRRGSFKPAEKFLGLDRLPQAKFPRMEGSRPSPSLHLHPWSGTERWIRRLDR